MGTVVENRTGFQKTKIGWIPEGWKVKTLGEIGETVNGLTYSPKDMDEKGVLVLRSSNVQNRQIVFDDNVYVKVEDEKYNKVRENDILICVRNGSRSLIGKNALITKEAEGMAFGAFMSIYRSPLSKYIFQLLDTDLYHREIHKNLGATINSINGSDLRKFKFPIPPEQERTEIVRILSTWDAAITDIQNLIQQLKHRKKGLMQQLLSGKKRLSGFDGEWETTRIGNVAKQYSAKNSAGEDITVLSCTKYDGLVPSLEYFGRQVYGDDTSKYKVVPRGYFAYATNHIEEGSIGLQTDFDKGLVSPMYTVFKTIDSINDDFFFRYLKTDRMIYKYQSNMSGSINRRGGLRWNDFKTIEITIPAYEEQCAIAKLFESVDAEIESFEMKLKSLESQKKGLMQQLLTGKKRVI